MKSKSEEQRRVTAHRDVWLDLTGTGVKHGQLHCDITIDVDVPKARLLGRQASVDRTNFL